MNQSEEPNPRNRRSEEPKNPRPENSLLEPIQPHVRPFPSARRDQPHACLLLEAFQHALAAPAVEAAVHGQVCCACASDGADRPWRWKGPDLLLELQERLR